MYGGFIFKQNINYLGIKIRYQGSFENCCIFINSNAAICIHYNITEIYVHTAMC